MPLRSLPRVGECCGQCGSRLDVDFAGVVSCARCPEPMYGEAVGFTDYGRGAMLSCGRCGFSGIPTYLRGEIVLECPRCSPCSGVPVLLERASRNAPCPCGSGVKTKKCHPERC